MGICIFHRHELTHVANDEFVGYIQLVNYSGCRAPHVEYKIYKQFRRKGFMTVHFPIFLKGCADMGFNQLVAIVKKNNSPSKKILKKNGFFLAKDMGDNLAYIVDLRLNKNNSEFIKIVDDLSIK